MGGSVARGLFLLACMLRGQVTAERMRCHAGFADAGVGGWVRGAGRVVGRVGAAQFAEQPKVPASQWHAVALQPPSAGAKVAGLDL
ncbi:hypothetical protein D1Y84_03930 [Acidipila sp. EB88]|nr:hypothetical protein D1Y84_03930 [Acidipila sp. EB88]